MSDILNAIAAVIGHMHAEGREPVRIYLDDDGMCAFLNDALVYCVQPASNGARRFEGLPVTQAIRGTSSRVLARDGSVKNLPKV